MDWSLQRNLDIRHKDVHLKRTVEPTVEPVTLSDMQSRLLGYNSNDDDYINGLITRARELFEEQTGIALLEQTWEMICPYFAERIKIPKPPLRSISSITYYDDAGDQQTLAASVYRVAKYESYAILDEAYNQDWPSTESFRPDAVTITFKAGIYTSDNGSPTESVDTTSGSFMVRKYAMAQEAIGFLVDHLYRNRAPVAGIQLHEIPMTFKTFINACRVEW